MNQGSSGQQGSSVPIRDGSEYWGKWFGDKHYSLEVAQHPLRARMCGFGDKDRRPLAPAAVARMVVRRQDNTIVDADEVDCSFFLVTVDLWSADGTQEMNLVLHPSSAESRFAPQTSKPRRRGNSNSASQHHSAHQAPASSSQPSPNPSSFHVQSPSDPQSAELTPTIQSGSEYSNQAYPFSQSPTTLSESVNFQSATYSHPPSDTWAYSTAQVDRAGLSAPAPDSIQSFGRNGSPCASMETGETWQPEQSSRELMAYRDWHADASYPPVDNSSGPSAFDTSSVDPSPSDSRSPGSDVRQTSWLSRSMPPSGDLGQQSRYSEGSFAVESPATQLGDSMYSSYSQNPVQASYHSETYIHNTPSVQPLSPDISHSSSQSYTRTLVGPLSSNACRLLDENRKPGIFFLFQDLSVRTEGTFRLRLRLMNVGAHPAPEGGALRVHTHVSPVLAQTFTESFVVFSAKRFPGVPGTTALSIAFGNQGQKLPLRNRKGSVRGRRQRSDSDGSNEDSDGG